MSKKRIAIIGAGVSGLPAIKSCIEDGMDPFCFDARGNLGGLWNYSEQVISSQGSVMKTTVTNTSKETTCYTDFPFPNDFPNYMIHQKFLEYLLLYAKQFDLARHIRFHTEAITVQRASDFYESGRWRILLKNIQTGEEWTEEFDGVLVCNGHFFEPHLPNFDGESIFSGRQLHSHELRSSSGFEGKVVVVVGVGNSGGDIATELSRVAKQVYLSTRTGLWLFGRLWNGGLPSDVALLRRVSQTITKILPTSLRNYAIKRMFNAQLDHSMYSLESRYNVLDVGLTTNDDLPIALATGQVMMKSDIRWLTETGVVFSDGSLVENVDVVIYATGYCLSFPFLPYDEYNVEDHSVDLFKRVFSPDVDPPTLAIIGCVGQSGPFPSIAELQCRWALGVFKGDLHLPSGDEMWKDIRDTKSKLGRDYPNIKRNAIRVEWMDYMDEISALAKCRPNLLLLMLTDPRLAIAMYFGPCTPAQYRLHGRGAWPGARDTILSTWDRVQFPLKTRRLGHNQQSGLYLAVKWIAISVVFVASWFLIFMY